MTRGSGRALRAVRAQAGGASEEGDRDVVKWKEQAGSRRRRSAVLRVTNATCGRGAEKARLKDGQGGRV